MKTITILEDSDKKNLQELQRIIIRVGKGLEANEDYKLYIKSELQRALNLLADFELEQEV